jgi:predicted Zn-dependent protease
MTRVLLPALLASLCGSAPLACPPLHAQAGTGALDEFRRNTPADEDSARALLRGLLAGAIARVEASELSMLEAYEQSDTPTAAADQERTLATTAVAREELTALLDTIVLRTSWGEAELQRLRRAHPASVVFLRYEAQLAVRDGRDDAAIVVYDRLLSARPADGELLRLRGEALARLGRSSDAIAAFARAFELEPGHEPTFRALLRLRRDENTLPDLLQQVRRLRLVHPDVAALAEYEAELLHRIGGAPTTAGIPVARAAFAMTSNREYP